MILYKYQSGGSMSRPTRQDSLQLMHSMNAWDKYPKTPYLKYPGNLPISEDYGYFKPESMPGGSNLKAQDMYIYNDTLIPSNYLTAGLRSENEQLPKIIYNPSIKPDYYEAGLFGSSSKGTQQLGSYKRPVYDKLRITPWDNLTPEEQRERLKKYGTTGTPIK
jgi:hypothetical protein